MPDSLRPTYNPNWFRPRNLLMLTALGAVVLPGCSHGPSKEARREQSIEVAHEAGFANARGREGDPNKLFVQFGACQLPVEVNRDSKTVSLSVESNLDYNDGSVEAGQAARVQDAFDHITHTTLRELTLAGLSGLENCTAVAADHQADVDRILG